MVMEAADNSEVIQNYLNDRLSAADRDAFESQLLSDPTLVRDLEVSLRLREGLAVLRDRHELAGMKPPGRRRLLMRFAGAAAAIVAAVALYPALRHVERSPALIAASVSGLTPNTNAPLEVVDHHSFFAARGSSETPAIHLPISGALELRALTGYLSRGRPFRVTLERNSSPLGAVDHVVPDGDGFVVIYANASKLNPGDYSLAVESEGADAKTADQFEFKLIRADGVSPY